MRGFAEIAALQWNPRFSRNRMQSNACVDVRVVGFTDSASVGIEIYEFPDTSLITIETASTGRNLRFSGGVDIMQRPYESG
jgi:hypothetical protein